MLKKLITISIIAIASLQAATTYNKSLTDGNDDLNYWSDTTDTNLNNHTLSGATEVFTIGSRKNIPNVPTSAIKVSTNKLCSDDRKGLVSCSKSDFLEPRYTDDGLATSGEANLRTWYKAATPKSVNGVVDNPCTSLSNTGSVVNWWVNFPSLRCERTITTYTPKVNSTIYTNKVNSDLFTNKLSSTSTTGGVNIYTDKVSTTVYTSKINGLTKTTNPYLTIWYDNCEGGTRSISSAKSYCASKGMEVLDFSYVMGVDDFGETVPVPGGIPTCGSSYTWTIWSSNWSNTGVSGSYVNNVSGYSDFYSNGYSIDKTFATRCMTSTPSADVCPSGYTDNGTNCKKTTLACPDASWSNNGANCTKVTPIVSVTNYYCPATYSDMGTYCKKTIQICPDPSWTSATATTCSKVIQICPDASWTDNGTNCKKNIPEYRLFSTF